MYMLVSLSELSPRIKIHKSVVKYVPTDDGDRNILDEDSDTDLYSYTDLVRAIKPFFNLSQSHVPSIDSLDWKNIRVSDESENYDKEGSYTEVAYSYDRSNPDKYVKYWARAIITALKLHPKPSKVKSTSSTKVIVSI